MDSLWGGVKSVSLQVSWNYFNPSSGTGTLGKLLNFSEPLHVKQE